MTKQEVGRQVNGLQLSGNFLAGVPFVAEDSQTRMQFTHSIPAIVNSLT